MVFTRSRQAQQVASDASSVKGVITVNDVTSPWRAGDLWPCDGERSPQSRKVVNIATSGISFGLKQDVRCVVHHDVMCSKGSSLWPLVGWDDASVSPGATGVA